MSSSMNLVVIVGRLGNDPELRHTASSVPVCSFDVATDSNYKEKKVTHWHKVIVWSKMGENCAKFLKKGREVAVQGRVEYRFWENKEGRKVKETEIIAESVQFLGGPKDFGGTSKGDETAAPENEANIDEVPF